MRLAIDLGEVRIGVARCDESAQICLPVQTLYRAGGQEIYEILDLVDQYHPIEIIVGLPRLLSGKEGKNAADVRQWSRKLTKSLSKCNVRLVDERLTSVTAHQQLREAGRKSTHHRAVIDQQAAVLILQQALEIEAKSNQVPGTLVGTRSRSAKEEL